MSNYGGNAASYLGGSPNILGGGMYQPGAINVDQGAFNNPLSGKATSAGNQEIENYLGATTPGVTAATSPFTAGAGVGLTGLAGTYGDLAAGRGPSAATVAAGQQGAANLASAESMLGSARGAGNPAAAQLAAQNARAQGAQQVAGNVVAGRTQEELGALGGLGNTYGALGQLGIAQQGQQNAVAMGNQQNLLNAHTNFLNSLTGVAGQQQQGAIAGQNLSANTALGQQGLANSAYTDAANRNNKVFGQVLGAATNAAGSLFGV